MPFQHKYFKSAVGYQLGRVNTPHTDSDYGERAINKELRKSIRSQISNKLSSLWTFPVPRVYGYLTTWLRHQEWDWWYFTQFTRLHETLRIAQWALIIVIPCNKLAHYFEDAWIIAGTRRHCDYHYEPKIDTRDFYVHIIKSFSSHANISRWARTFSRT